MSRVIQVFRTGTHTDSAGVTREFTAADLRAIAENFSPELGEAPIVKGHPATDDPAFGWVERFLFEESSGILYAVPKEIDPGFRAEVDAGRYKMISLALYAPDSPRNPKPGTWYPRHVGYLGAAAPAVKGLRAANFSDDGEGFSMFDLKNDPDGSKFTATLVAAFTTALEKMGFKGKPPASGDDGTGDAAKFAEAEEARKAAETALEEERKARRELEAKAVRAGCAAFTEELVTAGKLTPVEGNRLTEILFALSDTEEVEFTEGEGKDAKTVKATPRKALSEILKGLPVRIEYRERGTGHEDYRGPAFVAPEGSQVNVEKVDLNDRALAYAAEHKVDFLTAVSILEKGAK